MEEEKLYKVGDKVPRFGRYQCVVCGFIVEFLPQHVDRGVTFGSCPVCLSGTDAGQRKPDEDFWKYIG